MPLLRKVLRVSNRSMLAFIFFFSFSSSCLYFIYVAPGIGESGAAPSGRREGGGWWWWWRGRGWALRGGLGGAHSPPPACHAGHRGGGGAGTGGAG